MECWRNGEFHYSTAPLLLCSIPLIILRHFGPIHHVPPSFDVVRPAVLIIQIVGVFPNVHAKNWFVAIHEWAVLIWRRNDFEFPALIFDQPGPATAKTADSGGGKFFFKGVEPAKSRIDIVSQFTRGR